MALVGIAITLGSPDTAGQVPITVSNLAATIAQAVTDTTTLAGEITTAQTDATTADNDVATVQTDISTASADAGTANTKVGTCGTDFDSVCQGATDGVTTLFSNQTYNSTTKQLSGTPSVSVTLTVAQQEGLIAFLNTLGADLVTAKTDTGQVVSDLTTATTDATTAKAATAAAKTAAAALSTSAIATDHTNAQAEITSANVYLQTDSSVVTDVAALNGALVAALTFVRDNDILPT